MGSQAKHLPRPRRSLPILPQSIESPASAYPANTVRNITFVKVPFSSFMDERNEDVLGT